MIRRYRWWARALRLAVAATATVAASPESFGLHAAAQTPTERSTPAAAFTSHQVWDGDNGATIERLGIGQQSLFVTRNDGSLSKIPFKNDFGVGDARLVIQGDLVAYTGHSGDNGMQFRVVVADLDGREIASFSRALQPRWSPDGAHLAFQYLHYDKEWRVHYDSLGLWNRKTGVVRVIHETEPHFAWRSPDSLFLGHGQRILALILPSGRLVNTQHRGPTVSPDGRYSLGFNDGDMQYYRLTDDRHRLEVWGCAMDSLGFSGMGGEAYVEEPFWVRAPGAGHLLCVCPRNYSSPPRQGGCVTAVFDPRTLSFIRKIPGKLVTPTVDGRGCVVLRGDSLVVVDLSSLRDPQPSNPACARVKIEVEPWGNGHRGPVNTFVYDVQEGDRLPDHSGFGGGCQQFFRVDRIGVDGVSVSFEPNRFTTKTSTLLLTPSAVRLTTASVDGGATIALSLLPAK